jgi:hypothetical protein
LGTIIALAFARSFAATADFHSACHAGVVVMVILKMFEAFEHL